MGNATAAAGQSDLLTIEQTGTVLRAYMTAMKPVI